jgi:hypothetical protein
MIKLLIPHCGCHIKTPPFMYTDMRTGTVYRVSGRSSTSGVVSCKRADSRYFIGTYCAESDGIKVLKHTLINPAHICDCKTCAFLDGSGTAILTHNQMRKEPPVGSGIKENS